MRVAIMQPTYLPWIGYFALMDQVDMFVLLDDVQFEHRSWQHRNRIWSRDSSQWLTVPVSIKGRRNQRIEDALIDSARPWQRKHLGAILQNYSRAPWLPTYRSWLEQIYQHPPRRLCDLNRLLIEELARKLGIRTALCSSSELHANGDRVGRLIHICQEIGAAEYLSSIGSYDYIEADNRFPEAGIRLFYQHYEHPSYRQIQGDFVSHLSVLDLLLNEGPDSLDLLRSGTRRPYTSDEVPGVEVRHE